MTIINPDELDISRCLAIDTNTHLRIAQGIKDIIERDGIYSPLEILSEIRDYLADDNELVLATFIVFEIYISALQNEEPYVKEAKLESMKQNTNRTVAVALTLHERETVYTKILTEADEQGNFEFRNLQTGEQERCHVNDILSIRGVEMERSQGQSAERNVDEGGESQQVNIYKEQQQQSSDWRPVNRQGGSEQLKEEQRKAISRTTGGSIQRNRGQ